MSIEHRTLNRQLLIVGKAKFVCFVVVVISPLLNGLLYITLITFIGSVPSLEFIVVAAVAVLTHTNAQSHVHCYRILLAFSI